MYTGSRYLEARSCVSEARLGLNRIEYAFCEGVLPLVIGLLAQ